MPGTPATTPRLGLPRYDSNDPASLDTIFNAIVDTADTNIARHLTGTFAARPAASVAGRIYIVTSGSTNLGAAYLDLGASWLPIVPEEGAPGMSPIGAIEPYAGTADPANGRWVLADGRLIDKTVHADFFSTAGHAYNGGVDPGGNSVRIPDLRGRAIVGADNMGTAQGAANRIPNSNRARGQSGGEERHVLTIAELASHNHNGATGGQSANHVHGAGASRTFVRANQPIATIGVNSGGPAPSPTTQQVTGSFSNIDTTDSANVDHSHAIPSQGSGTAHNVMQPYEVSNMIVRVK